MQWAGKPTYQFMHPIYLLRHWVLQTQERVNQMQTSELKIQKKKNPDLKETQMNF